MKITLFIGGLSGGGSERVACNLVNYLCDQGNAVDIVTMSDAVPSYEVHTKIHRHILLYRHERGNLVYNTLLRYRRLKEYIKTSDTQKYVVMLPLTTIFLLLLHRHIKVPVIVAERADPAHLPCWEWFLIKRLSKYASGFVFQTQEAQGYYMPYIKNKPSVIIPNAINPAFIRVVNTKHREKQIIAVGRLTEQKNFMLLLRAFASVHKEFPEYTLSIYGQGEQRTVLERFIKQHNLKNSVFLPGYVKDIPQRLLAASVFVLSSDYEGMPNALMEAMASGLTCVSTDCPCGGPRFLIKDEKNGLLVPVGNQLALENALHRVLSDKALRIKLAQNAIQIQQTLAPEIIYKKWAEFISAQTSKQNKEK